MNKNIALITIVIVSNLFTYNYFIQKNETISYEPIVKQSEPKTIINNNCDNQISDAQIEKAFKLLLAGLGLKLINENFYFSKIVKEINKKSNQDINFNESIIPIREEAPLDLIDIKLEKVNASKQLIKDQNFNLNQFSIDEEILPKSKLDYFKNNILKDPKISLAQSTNLQSEMELKKINGSYSGQIHIKKEEDNDFSKHSLFLEFQFLKSDEKITGNYNLKLFKDGYNYSNKRGNGENRDIRVHPELNGYLLEASPDTFIHVNSTFTFGHLYKDGKLNGFIELMKN